MAKQYNGYTDRYLVSPIDMKAPAYLQEYIDKAGTEWLVLLKKEIHARHGAIFTDPVAGEIFRGCSWYKAKYNLDLDTVSRLPQKEKLTDQELINFGLIEGEYLSQKKEENKGMIIAADLNGNVYYVKIGKVFDAYSGNEFYSAFGFPNRAQYDKEKVQNKINGILNGYGMQIIEEQYYSPGGC
jgi:hypothetical protein